MSKPWTPKRQTVELQPSRIRREPPPEARAAKLTIVPDDSEREARTVVIGIALFALAITFLIFWISDFTAG